MAPYWHRPTPCPKALPWTVSLPPEFFRSQKALGRIFSCVAGGRRAHRTLSPLTRIGPLSVSMRRVRMRPQEARSGADTLFTVLKAGKSATPAERRLRFRMPANWDSPHSSFQDESLE